MAAKLVLPSNTKAPDSELIDGIDSSSFTQQSFKNFKIGETLIVADDAHDTVEFIAGDNISLTPSANDDTITIAVTGMSQVSNQNAFSYVKAVNSSGTSLGQADADTTTDTLILKEGTNISLTVDAANDTITINNNYSYTHPTTDGNLHVPANGTSNANKFLKASGTAGSYSWSGVTASDVGLGNVANESKSTMFTNAALTGTPTAPTAIKDTSTTQIATTAYVKSQGYLTDNQPITLSGDASGLSTLTQGYGNNLIVSAAMNADSDSDGVVNDYVAVDFIGGSFSLNDNAQMISISNCATNSNSATVRQGFPGGTVTIPCTPGEVVSFKADVKFVKTAGSPKANIQLYFRKADGTYISGFTSSNIVATTSGYTQLSIDNQTAPANTEIITVGLNLTTSASASTTSETATVWFKNASLTKVSNISSLILTLADSGVSAGTYTKVGVDSKGRVTSGDVLTASDIPSLSWSKITSGKPTTLTGYGITDALALTGGTLSGDLSIHAKMDTRSVKIDDTSDVNKFEIIYNSTTKSLDFNFIG